MRLIIIGSGIAALSAVDNFRKHDKDTEVTIITEDSCPTYYRIKLSHYLSKVDFTDEELLVKDPSWYKENKIDMVLNSRVSHVDFDDKKVYTSSGDSFKYDMLLLANGSHPFVPPYKGVDKKGVFTLHSLNDLKSIQNFMKDKERAVIIGGGLLGLEAAHGLIEMNKSISVLEYFPYLLPRQLDAELSKAIQEQLAKEGITFHLGSTCEEILGDDTVSGILLSSGEEIKSDVVIISTGIRPNTDLFKDCNLAVEKGVLVNDRMETNISGVYAAGDIAQYNGSVFGLWTASNEQGKIAGTNLAGKDMTYAAPQHVATLNIGEVKLFSVGDISDPESTITYRDEKSFHRLFVKSGHVVGAVLTGDLSLMLKAKNMVIHKKEVPSSKEDGSLFMELMQ